MEAHITSLLSQKRVDRPPLPPPTSAYDAWLRQLEEDIRYRSDPITGWQPCLTLQQMRETIEWELLAKFPDMTFEVAANQEQQQYMGNVLTIRINRTAGGMRMGLDRCFDLNLIADHYRGMRAYRYFQSVVAGEIVELLHQAMTKKAHTYHEAHTEQYRLDSNGLPKSPYIEKTVADLYSEAELKLLRRGYDQRNAFVWPDGSALIHTKGSDGWEPHESFKEFMRVERFVEIPL